MSQSGANTAESIATRVQASVVSVVATAPPKKQAPEVGQLSPAPTVALDDTFRGAGTIISSDGLILTAASILEEATKVVVTLAGGRSHEATIVGRDVHTNLGLVRINASGLRFLQPASAADLTLGERLLIFGRSVLAAESSPIVTDGLVSLVYNPNMNAAPFIQTSAPVHPGMGGGPVIREKTGEFVGVVTQQYVPKVGAPITFAVPLDEFIPIAADLQSTGRADRGTIGTRISILSAEDAAAIGLPARSVVVIVSTRTTGPADKAGALAGDVVLSVNGVEVQSPVAYSRAISAKPSGTTFVLEVYRRGRIQRLEMVSERVQ